ncbi:uncharacterized protein LOC113235301 [Hyposmocoma kahamanoa]|uniref:uncharacterized protein LOC113235301 n=1 Tax=Hyposmocoma kahamanoa TaxID=1477025 RepID=UPI000E6D88C9|nr:uncharacterized protein LOC113235301 [Hyposmocoma kahamanoa]
MVTTSRKTKRGTPCLAARRTDDLSKVVSRQRLDAGGTRLHPVGVQQWISILTTWLTSELDEAQPIEQAGFRSGFSTIYHIHTVNQLMGKCLEFNRPLVMAFVDYEKAFDSIKHWAVFHAPYRCHIDSR